jgi:hypothetical protein
MENSGETEIKHSPIDNLIPFKPGESGNPNGRPKDTPLDKMVKKAAKQIIAEYREALTEALPMIKPVLVAKAMEGDLGAIKELHDRTMDKAKQPTDITSDGKSIVVELIKYENKNTP